MARKRYNKGKRVDMRQGGRVQLAHGGEPKREDYGDGQRGQEAYNKAWSAWNAAHANNTTSTPTNPFPDTGNVPYGNVTEEQATTARTQIEDAAKGIVADDSAAKIQAPQTLVGKDGVPADTIVQKENISKVGTTADAKATTAVAAPKERVFTQTTAPATQQQQAKTITKAGVERTRDKVEGPKTAEGQVTREAGVDEIRALTQEAEAAGMPSDQALEKAKADVITGQLSAGAVANIISLVS